MSGSGKVNILHELQFDTSRQKNTCAPLLTYIIYTCTEKVEIPVFSYSRHKKMKLANDRVTFIWELNALQNFQKLLPFTDHNTFYSHENDSSG